MTPDEREARLAILMAQVSLIMADQCITQAELARRMDTHPAVVSRALKLQVDCRMSTFGVLLDALDCELVIQRRSIA